MSTSLSSNLPWDLASNRWAQQINPLLANPANNVLILSNVNLKIGTNVINHLLGKTQQGWFLVDIQGVSDVYRDAPLNNLTLSLNSSAAVTVSIGVF